MYLERIGACYSTLFTKYVDSLPSKGVVHRLVGHTVLVYIPWGDSSWATQQCKKAGLAICINVLTVRFHFFRIDLNYELDPSKSRW